MQQWLFSNSISISLSGKLGSNGFIHATPLPIIVCLGENDVKLGSNGFIHATPLPIIVCLGENDVLFGCNVSDTIPVFPGSIHILFLTVNGIEIC